MGRIIFFTILAVSYKFYPQNFKKWKCKIYLRFSNTLLVFFHKPKCDKMYDSFVLYHLDLAVGFVVVNNSWAAIQNRNKI